MNSKKYLIIILLITVSFSTDLYARRHFYRNGRMTRNYNSATVESIKGTVLTVIKRTGNRGEKGIHLTVKTSKETIDVHLGPDWFVSKKIALAKGDKVEIEGSRITYSSKEVIIAKKIKKGNSVVILRNDYGTPVWSGKGVRARRR